MKRFLAMMLAGAMLLSLMSGATFMASAETEGDFEYSLHEGEAEIIGYTGEGGDVTVPSTLGGVPVTMLGENAFSGCTSLVSVTVSGSVTMIDDKAFSGCTALKNIDVASDNSIYSSIDGVLFADEGMLLDCYPLGKSDTSYTVPSDVMSISFWAFSYHPFLESITLPAGMMNIGDCAFWGCESLTSVTIPGTVTSIGSGAFGECNKLETVHFIGTEEMWNNLSVFEDNECLTDAAVSFETGSAVSGDADGDGELTMKDVLTVRKSIAKIGPCYNPTAADFDGDGEVTMKDVLGMRKQIAGIR